MRRSTKNIIKVLLVEDDEEDIQLTVELLKEQKIEVHLEVARDGEEAIQLLRSKEGNVKELPNLIILDLNMPRKNGIEFLREKQLYKHLKPIPVIILTSSHSQNDVDSGYEEGASCFVTKPAGIAEYQFIVDAISKFWFTVVKFPAK